VQEQQNAPGIERVMSRAIIAAKEANVTFTTVLLRSIVIKSCCGCLRSWGIYLLDHFFEFSNFFRYILESEKSAVSEDEKNPESTRDTTINMTLEAIAYFSTSANARYFSVRASISLAARDYHVHVQ